jgi:hypothetical protein
MRWRAYFEDRSGRILRSIESWTQPEEAALWGNACLLRPEAFSLEDPDGQEVSAQTIDAEAGITVEGD